MKLIKKSTIEFSQIALGREYEYLVGCVDSFGQRSVGFSLAAKADWLAAADIVESDGTRPEKYSFLPEDMRAVAEHM